MERFEIEDIIRQDANGVVFRAIDNESGDTIAIHRFFPFGQYNGGLDEDESVAFANGAEKLSEIAHPALRSVIAGGTDPIDHIPYLASQWVKGVPMRIILTTETLDSDLVIDILRSAIEVSVILSQLFGEDAIWIDTEVESIVVGTEASGRGFTFSISPLKWLGTDSNSKSLLSIVELGERLTGSKGKILTKSAGRGLGDWLKQTKKDPDISLHDALASLADSTGNEPPLPEEIIVSKAVRPTIKTRKSSSKRILVTTVILLLGITSATLIHLNRTGKAPFDGAEYAKQKISETIIEFPKPLEAKSTTINKSQPARPKTPVTSQKKPSKQRDNEHIPPGVIILSPNDVEAISKIKTKQPASVKGVVKTVKIPSGATGLYIIFSAPADPTEIRVVIFPGNFQGGPYNPKQFKKIESDYQKLVGKTVLFEGVAYRYTGRSEPHFVRISKRNQIKIGK